MEGWGWWGLGRWVWRLGVVAKGWERGMVGVVDVGEGEGNANDNGNVSVSGVLEKS